MATTANSLATYASEPVLWFDDSRCIDVSQVGGKNASLANMTCTLLSAGIRVPPGFATTAEAYRSFLRANGLETRLREQLDAYHAGRQSLEQTGSSLRQMIVSAELTPGIAEALLSSYRELAKRCGTAELAVAVRSSATAEDLPQASFAGQQETFFNVRGEAQLLLACRKCYASLFTDRAIVYRETNGFDHCQVALSIGIQKMVRADRAGAGVMFTLDTETGFPGVVVVNAAWGLGRKRGARDRRLRTNTSSSSGCWPMSKCRPIIEKSLGAKEEEARLRDGGRCGAHATSTPRRRAGRDGLDRRGDPAAGAVGGGGREALRQAHGHRVGQGR